MWNLVLVCSVMVLVLEQDSCMVCAIHTIASEIVLCAPDGFLGDEAQGKLVSVSLEIVLIMTQDWSMVYAKHTIGLDIVLYLHPDGTPR
jgi:hypothetical protein